MVPEYVPYSSPIMDASQDWHIEHGFEENGWTVLGFNRSLDTCDTVGDRPITADVLRLIYAYGDSDPSDANSLYKHSHKGSKMMSLLTQSPPPVTLPADSQTIDFLIQNVSIYTGSHLFH